MHRGRFGGNARKRKAKLTDATFQAMIGGPSDDPAVATIETEITVEVFVAAVGVPVDTTTHQPYGQSAMPAGERRFRCQDYQFGYAVCRNCHNDQAYYVHQDDLAGGYTFRCRICRLELTVNAQA